MKSKCNNPNEIITNLQQENKELKAHLSKANKDLKKSSVDLKNEQTKTHELNEKLSICEANQQESGRFNITCKFGTTIELSEYFCETHDLTIHHKDMKLNEVI